MALTKTPLELSSTPGIVDNSNATAITIDSSGNLLVGTTSTAVSSSTGSVTGSVINNSGLFEAAKTGTVMELNRLTADGKILNFRKDATTVGSIGAYNSANYIQSGSAGSYTGLYFNTNKIEPVGDASGDIRTDATVDLGSTANRFKDLYLSGGVYLGGTGAANKLDDYEEGTWTPSLPNGGTLTSNTAYYTKIGRQVHLQFYLSVINATASTTAFQIGGLPFTSLAGSTYPAGTISYCADGNLSGLGMLSAQSNDYLYFHYIDGTNGNHVTNNEMRALFGTANSGVMIASITYLTAA
jgi:hypothetical protein